MTIRESLMTSTNATDHPLRDAFSFARRIFAVAFTDQRIVRLIQPGFFTTVDSRDYELATSLPLSLKTGGRYGCKYGYARSGKVKEMLHRLITGAPEGMDVDHIDGDGLNNSRSNLRVVTHRQNCMNSRKRKLDSTSSLKGVSFYSRTGKWQAQIAIPQKVHLGYYRTQEEAGRAYDKAAALHFGEFAFLNFPIE